MLTLKDIAEHVGVSVSTVSLVLNERDQGRVNAAAAARIREVAAEMGYVPNLLAKGLKTKQSKTLGLLAEDVASSSFAGDMVVGAQDAAWREGYLLLLIDVGGNAGMEAPAVRALLQRNIEALIVAADFHREVAVPLVPRSVPLVLLDGRPRLSRMEEQEGGTARRLVDWVVPDESGGAHDAVRLLLDAGHRRIALCTVSDPRFVAAEQRAAGYEQALRDVGITPDPSLIVEATGPTAVDGRPAIERLLEADPAPTAVFCFSDKLAMAAYQVARERGLRIPEDLSVVGFDDQRDIADALTPDLTTVRLPHREMGEWASRRAIHRLNTPAVSTPDGQLMPCPVVERGSVAPPSR